MSESVTLLLNIDKIHTTPMGVDRIRKNLNLNLQTDNVVEFCKKLISKEGAKIERNGKNWYVTADNCIVTINAYSYTIITAHAIKKGING